MPHISYARKMRKNMLHICGTWSIYPAYMRRIFRQIPHIFPHILPQKVPHILRKFSAINQHRNLEDLEKCWMGQSQGNISRETVNCYFHVKWPNWHIVQCPITTWMADCQQMGQPSRHITNHHGQLSLPSLWVLTIMAGVKAQRIHLCQVASNTVWSHMAGDAP